MAAGETQLCAYQLQHSLCSCTPSCQGQQAGPALHGLLPVQSGQQGAWLVAAPERASCPLLKEGWLLPGAALATATAAVAAAATAAAGVVAAMAAVAEAVAMAGETGGAATATGIEAACCDAACPRSWWQGAWQQAG